MLNINKVQQIEDVVVYQDDKKFNVFYLVPEQPRFRVDDNGRPMFSFIKYRLPIDRPDGRTGGGFAIFDVEFSVPKDQLERIKNVLGTQVATEARAKNLRNTPSIRIGAINYSKGTANLLLSDENSVLIEKIRAAGKPSLYGKNISTYNIELTPEGATILEQALQGKGGFFSVVYELYFPAKLPPITVDGTWHAHLFYKFVQEIDVEERFWSEDSYKEALNEISISNDIYNIKIEDGGNTNEKIISAMIDWVQRTLDDSVERRMIEALPVEDPEEARKLYTEHDIENVKRDITRRRIADVKVHYERSATVEWNVNPQGTLPNITELVDNKGKPILWKDHARTIDAADPFFTQHRVDVSVNADFEALPIDSIEVRLSYDEKPMSQLGDGSDGEHLFLESGDVAHFASFIAEGVNIYQYSYQVNYQGEARSLKSETFETALDDTTLRIGVDDMGILLVDLSPGDLNFTQVTQVQVVMQYEDPSNDISLIEDQFIINEENPEHRFQKVIFVERTQPYKYKVKYFMHDGKEYELDWVEGQSEHLFINDPFKNTKKIGLRATGDLDNEIETIYVDMQYADEANSYTKETSIALSSRQPFFDWEFPVIDENIGVVSYSGNIVFKDGTIQEIPETVTESRTPIIGETIEDKVEIMILADLIDFDETKLIRLEMRYQDEENDVLERKDFVFGGSRPKEANWRLKLEDKDRVNYEWEATYFMADGSRRPVGPVTTDDLTLLLEVPA